MSKTLLPLKYLLRSKRLFPNVKIFTNEMTFWLDQCPICEVKNGSGKKCLNCKNMVCIDCYPNSNICLICHIDSGLPLSPEWKEKVAKLYEPGGSKYKQSEEKVKKLF